MEGRLPFVTYNQVVLEHRTTITRTKVAWIPSRFAKIGKFLRINDDNGWEVVSVDRTAMTEEYVMSHRDDYRYQRKVSDV